MEQVMEMSHKKIKSEQEIVIANKKCINELEKNRRLMISNNRHEQSEKHMV